ncbi:MULTISPECIES: chromosomal replication initiator protein DnaA [unclassified Sphingobium]|jgi:chromosomal replication initiator protein|uniref:chromosomal replication initiator protein DnaA n=1 Tax=unclassified Sphingobium TaxID=2611147 RepID=UPI001E34393C|nr:MULTISPECIES: chromosomal replication initiator protein DnaA [unclassified Sphingobium]GLI97267.1 chromosomal replication initiator protein DnaA [Sphingobium sp. BS19]CAH0351980.1 Chromosomal replication initiator protein DnaA [Sphingobium sp. CECT 9361]
MKTQAESVSGLSTGHEQASESAADVTGGSSHLEAAWAQLRVGLRSDIGARMFDQWLKPARLGAYCDMTETLDILVASEFSANFVSAQFGDRLRLAWRSAHAGVRDIRIVRAPDSTALRVLSAPAPQAAATAPAAQAAPSFLPRHDFASFITGESNQLAYSAAQAMAAPEQPRFSPLFIHGGTGQGKTHLLHAIAGAYLAHAPEASVVYMSAERFMMEFVNAMRANETMAFKARLRAVRLLLIDDIQFIAGKGATQEEFLHTINELVESGARIVISADRAPQQLDAVDPRILSRLAGGLVADIQPAGIDLRLAILEAKRLVAGDPPVPDAVIDFLARSIRSNIRELEGAFNKLLAYGQLTGRTVDLEFAQAMLADAVRANARRITVDEIQKACAAHYRIDASEMRSKRRARAIARPRQVAMYLAKKMTPRSLPEIGRIFGGRDHSTVIHAVRTIEALRESNPDIDADVRALLRQLEG